MQLSRRHLMKVVAMSMMGAAAVAPVAKELWNPTKSVFAGTYGPGLFPNPLFPASFFNAFTGPNQNPLDVTQWENINIDGANLEVLNHSLTTCFCGTDPGDDGTSLFIGGTMPTNYQWSAIKINGLNGNMVAICQYLNASAFGNTCYVCIVAGPAGVTNGATLTVYQIGCSGGCVVYTWVNTVACTVNVGDQIAFAIYKPLGSTSQFIQCFRNGVSMMPAEPLSASGTILSGGTCGLQIANLNAHPLVTDVSLVDWMAGGSSPLTMPKYLWNPGE